MGGGGGGGVEFMSCQPTRPTLPERICCSGLKRKLPYRCGEKSITKPLSRWTVHIISNVSAMISLGYNHHMVTLYLNGNPPWLKVFGDDQKPRVVVVTVLTSLILLLYDGLMVSHVIAPKVFFFS